MDTGIYSWEILTKFVMQLTNFLNIFDTNDVCDLDDEELEQIVRNYAEIIEGSAITIGRSAESTFVIFNLV